MIIIQSIRTTYVMHFTHKNTRMIFCDFDIIRLATLKKFDLI